MKRWYLLAYDVRDPRRLQRVHYFLSRQALALQHSVFLVKENQAGLQAMLKGIKDRVNSREDDVRLYPISHPNVIWAAGKQVDVMTGLYSGVSKKHRKQKPQNLLNRLLNSITKRND